MVAGLGAAEEKIDNANVAGSFKCAGCGLDGLKFGRCSRKLKEKGWMPCGNKQVLLAQRVLEMRRQTLHG